MTKLIKPKRNSLHLYNPEEEGLGSYDVHYINAYKKKKNESNHEGFKMNMKLRKVAWFHS